MRILLIEDDLIARALMERALGKWGYEVIAARDGKDAWRLIQDGAVRVVIGDWITATTDGANLCQAVQAAELARRVYFVFLIERHRKEDAVDASAAGGDDYLVKPVELQELRARLRTAERILGLQDELADARAELDRLAA